MEFKKILCATDYSEPSYKALEVAQEIALKYKGELYLTHVIAPIPSISPVAAASLGLSSEFDIYSYQQELDIHNKQTLDEIIKTRISNKLKTNPVVRYGDVANEIIDLAAEENIDLIVISTHGTTGLLHMLLGSIAEKVVRLAKSPVLTIRASEAK